MPLKESDWAALSPVNSSAPASLESDDTLVPSTFFSVVTGNKTVKNITPPITKTHILALQFDGGGSVGEGGNVQSPRSPVQGCAMLLIYNSNTKKYVPVG